jgi:hypothetical protein
MAAPIFMDTARPPASSEELTMREPLDRRWRLRWSEAFVVERLLAAAEAEEFVLILNDISFP